MRPQHRAGRGSFLTEDGAQFPRSTAAGMPVWMPSEAGVFASTTAGWSFRDAEGLSTLAELAVATWEPIFTPSSRSVKIRRLALRIKPSLREQGMPSNRKARKALNPNEL